MTPSETAECYQVPNQDPWCGIHGSEDWSTCAVKRKELEAALAAKDAEIAILRGRLEPCKGCGASLEKCDAWQLCKEQERHLERLTPNYDGGHLGCCPNCSHRRALEGGKP